MKYKYSKWVIHNKEQKVDKFLLEKQHNKTGFFKEIKQNRDNYFNNIDISNHNHNNNLLEYCTDDNYNKLWFDIDMIKIEIDDLKVALTEFFDLIDDVVGKKLNRKSYYIYYKRLPNKTYTHSIRIINWYYKISYEDNSNLCKELLKNSSKSIIASCIDKTTSIYHKNRAIQLPYNSKIISTKYDEFKNIYGDLCSTDSNIHFFVDYNYKDKDHTKVQTVNVEKYTISYIIICEDTIEFTTDKIENEKQEQLQTYTLNIDYTNREKRLLDTDNIIDELINNLDANFYKAKYSKNWIGLLKLLKPLWLKDIDKYLSYSVDNGDKLEYTIQKNKQFYNKLGNDTDDERLQIKKYTLTYTYICNYLNTYQDKYIFYTQHFTSIINHLSLWVCEKINMEKTQVIDIFKKYENYNHNDFKKIKNIIKITDIIKYNVFNGFLYKDTIILGNYYVEEQYYKNHKENDDIFDLVEDKLIIDNKLNDNINNKLQQFKSYEFKTLVIEAKCATGKSYYILNDVLKSVFNSESNINIDKFLKEIMDYENINDNVANFITDVLFNEQNNHILLDLQNLKRQIIISPNNSLGKKEYQDCIKQSGSCFITHEHILDINNYIQKTEDEDKRRLLYKIKSVFVNYLSVISSLESCDKIKINNKHNNGIDTVYLDEFDTIMNKWDIKNKTFKGKDVLKDEDTYIPKIEYQFECFIDICKKAKRIIIMDAHINRNNNKIKKFLQIIGDENVYKIKIKYNKFVDEKYKLKFYDNTELLLDNVFNNITLKEPKNYELAFTSNNKAKDVFKSLICECYDENMNLIVEKHQRIGLVNSEGLMVYDTENIKNCIICDTLFIIEDEKEDIEQSKSDIKNTELNNKFKKIIATLQIDKVKSDVIRDMKEELQNDYEYIITEKYKFTIYLRTPTIECGLSLNIIYFYTLFVFIYAGLFITEKSYQSLFRSRNLQDKSIHITCYNRHITQYKNTFDLQYMKNHLRTITNIGKSNMSCINIKKLEKNETETYKNIRDKDLKEFITINELEKLNSDKFFYQELFDVLFYNGFRLDKDIEFVSGNVDRSEIVDDMKLDRELTNYHNFKLTNIMDLTQQQITKLKILYNKDNKTGISNQYRNKYSKYLLLNNSIRYEPIYQYFLIKNKSVELKKIIEDNNDIDGNAIIDIDFDNIILNNKDYYNNYYELINSYNNITKYNLYNFNNKVKDICSQLKRILKLPNGNYSDGIELTEQEKITLRIDKHLYTLLKFLKIDLLKDYNKRVVKRFVFDNSKKLQYLTGFTNDIISNTNTLDIDDECVCFLLWIQDNLLYDYNNHLPYTNKKTRLNTNTDMNLIKDIINYYLHKINLYFDYEFQQKNSSRNDKALQFFINKEYDIRIVDDKVYINKFYFNNNKIETENDNVEQYTKQFTIMNNKQQKDIDTLKNDYVLKNKNIHKPSKTILNVVNGYVKVNIKVLPINHDTVDIKQDTIVNVIDMYNKDDSYKKTLIFKQEIEDVNYINKNKDYVDCPYIKIIPTKNITEEITKVKKNRTAIKLTNYYYYDDDDDKKIELEKEEFNSYKFANKVECKINIVNGKASVNLFNKYDKIKQYRLIEKQTEDKQKRMYIINNEINRCIKTKSTNFNLSNELIEILKKVSTVNVKDNDIHNKSRLTDAIKNKIQPITIIHNEDKYIENFAKILSY